MALLCTDYKVLSRALSNRLKDILEIIVHPDQTYCIRDRTIMDNIFLVPDVIDVCKSEFVLGEFVVQGCIVSGEGGGRVESANPCKARD